MGRAFPLDSEAISAPVDGMAGVEPETGVGHGARVDGPAPLSFHAAVVERSQSTSSVVGATVEPPAILDPRRFVWNGIRMGIGANKQAGSKFVTR